MKQVITILFALCCLMVSTARAQFVQQGLKLVGTGPVGLNVQQGGHVSISADGNSAIVGGAGDSNGTGAAWVFTRSGVEWSQQGSKLVGTGAVGNFVGQGNSVSISADGNTAIEGGSNDSDGYGAAWVFTRSGGAWTQQGSKLVGTGAIGTAGQGSAVSISADGNTAIVGGYFDNSGIGAVWVFTRSGGVWSQQGAKLVGTGTLYAYQGNSVAISGDGNTAIVGGSSDNGGFGAAWVFTRSGGVWTQQGSKLVGTGGVNPRQGSSVSISADGNTVIVGGPGDETGVGYGASWVFTRSGGVWSQQGNKLVGTGIAGTTGPYQGSSVSISADGNTAIAGGDFDDESTGAVWVFMRSGGVWSQLGSKLVGTGGVNVGGIRYHQGSSVSISADGSTVISGGPFDNNLVGAAWVFVKQYSLMATAGANGVISPTGSVLVTPGSSQRFTFTPASGYHVDSVIVDGVNVPDSMSGYTFVNVMTDHTIRVVFKINQYTIVATAGANGIITPTGSISVNYGTTRQFTFTPASGYYVDSVIVDGVNIPDSMSGYTFVNVTTSHTIRVVFVPSLPLTLIDGWNMLSVPYVVSDYSASSIYPTATSRAFTYEGSYQSRDTLRYGSGYWLKFDSGQSVTYDARSAIVRETTNVTIGWNMIGSISKPIAASLITSIPGGVGTSQFFGYFNGYTIADSIIPGRAYWVRVNQSCKLILSSSLVTVSLNRIQIIPGVEQPPPVPDDLVNSSSKGLPRKFTLDQNYPNPFNPTTSIRYQLPVSAAIKLRVYNTLGQVVATLFDGIQDAGYNEARWNAESVTSGVYFYKLEAVSINDMQRSFTQVRKMVLMK
jgi:hypothetical protein